MRDIALTLSDKIDTLTDSASRPISPRIVTWTRTERVLSHAQFVVLQGFLIAQTLALGGAPNRVLRFRPV